MKESFILYQIKKRLNKYYGKFISFCLKKRLGKTRFGASVIFFILRLLEKTTYYVNTKELNRKGHYVPQFILNNFKIKNNESKLGFLNSFSKKTREIKEEKPIDVAQEINFYTFKDKLGNDSDFVEKKLFGPLETSFSRILPSLINTESNYKFTCLESSIIATYLGFQITRTPKFYMFLEKYIKFLIEEHNFDFKKKLFIGRHNFDMEGIEKYIINNYFKVSLSEIENYKPNISFTNMKSILQRLSEQIANKISKEIHKKNIFIFNSEENNFEKMVISDHPVVMYENGFKKEPVWWEINNNNICLIFPLSPTRAIYVRNAEKKDGGNYESDDNVIVNMNNAGQFIGSYENIFSDDKEYLDKLINYFRNEI